jgi:hypothetical protein
MGGVHITYPCIRFTLAGLLVAAMGGRSLAGDTLRFIRPAPAEVITTNSLPIEVEPQSDRAVDSVVFLATYLDAGYSESDTVFRHWRLRHLTTDSLSPYRTIWDIAQLQDHYHRRILINARAYLSDGDTLKSGIDDFVVDRNLALKTRYVARALPAPSTRRGGRKDRWDKHGQWFSVADNRVRFLVEWSSDTLFVAVRVVDAAIFAVPSDNNRFWGAIRWSSISIWVANGPCWSQIRFASSSPPPMGVPTAEDFPSGLEKTMFPSVSTMHGSIRGIDWSCRWRGRISAWPNHVPGIHSASI